MIEYGTIRVYSGIPERYQVGKHRKFWQISIINVLSAQVLAKSFNAFLWCLWKKNVVQFFLRLTYLCTISSSEGSLLAAYIHPCQSQELIWVLTVVTIFDFSNSLNNISSYFSKARHSGARPFVVWAFRFSLCCNTTALLWRDIKDKLRDSFPFVFFDTIIYKDTLNVFRSIASYITSLKWRRKCSPSFFFSARVTR